MISETQQNNPKKSLTVRYLSPLNRPATRQQQSRPLPEMKLPAVRGRSQRPRGRVAGRSLRCVWSWRVESRQRFHHLINHSGPARAVLIPLLI